MQHHQGFQPTKKRAFGDTGLYSEGDVTENVLAPLPFPDLGQPFIGGSSPETDNGGSGGGVWQYFPPAGSAGSSSNHHLTPPPNHNG